MFIYIDELVANLTKRQATPAASHAKLVEPSHCVQITPSVLGDWAHGSFKIHTMRTGIMCADGSQYQEGKVYDYVMFNPMNRRDCWVVTAAAASESYIISEGDV